MNSEIKGQASEQKCGLSLPLVLMLFCRKNVKGDVDFHLSSWDIANFFCMVYLKIDGDACEMGNGLK